MAAQIVSLFQRFRPSKDWTQQEVAEFYRVEAALVQAGLQVETDRGLSDEGDPWFAFCRSDNGDVFIHFARIDGKYIAVGAALDRVVGGIDFPTLIQEMVASQAWTMARARKHSNIFLHPAALLIALVGGAFFHSGEAKAAELSEHGRSELRRHALPILIRGGQDTVSSDLTVRETTAILSSVLIGLNSGTTSAETLATRAGASARQLAALAPPPLGPLPVEVVNAPAHSAPAFAPDSVRLPQLFAHFIPPPTLTASAGSGLVPIQWTPPTVVQDHHEAIVTPAYASAVLLQDSGASAVALGIAALTQLSSYEAAQVIQSSGVVTPSEVQPLAPPNAYLLTELIGHSSQINIASSSPSGSIAGASTEGASTEGTAVTPSAPIAPTTQTETTTTVASTATISSPAASSEPTTPSPAPVSLPANEPAAAAAVSLFVSEVHQLDVLISGHDIILYDEAIFGPLPAGATLGSLTFNFSDGSSISLVGTTSELHSIHT